MKVTIYPRGGVLWLRYSFDGKLIRYSLQTNSREKAEIERARIEYELLSGQHRPQQSMIFEKLLEEYLTWSAVRRKPSTYRRYVSSGHILRLHFDGKNIGELTSRDLELYQNRRKGGLIDENTGVRIRPATNATINRDTVMVRHMFKKAVEWVYLTANPFRDVRLLKEPPGRERYVKPDEWVRLLNAATTEIRWIIVFTVHTGVRLGEMCGLKWSDIDWPRRRMTIRETKNNRPRTVFMNSVVFQVLTEVRQTTQSEYVFPGHDQKQRSSIRTAFKATCRRAGVTDLRYHDLRHTFGTYLNDTGCPTRTAQVSMGHLKIESTERYMHPGEDVQRHAVEAIVHILPYSCTILAQSSLKPGIQPEKS